MSWIDPFAVPNGVGAVVVKATLLLGCALLAAWALRRAAAGVRHLVWVAVLASVLALPALGRWTPLAVPLLPPSEGSVTANALEPQSVPIAPSVSRTDRAELGAASASERSTTARESSGVAAETEAMTADSVGIRAWWVLLAVWGVVAATLVGWLVAGAFAVRRIVRAARPLGDDRWTSMLYEVADRLDLADAPRLVASDRVEMPFASGVLQPVVVLPATAEEWSDDLRRLVLFHELAHVRRRDLLGHTLGRLACAFYWFHPLVWTAAKRLRAESEKACDDLVLECGARASDYAEHLLRMVVGVRRFGAPALALPMARRTEFEGRVLAILDPSAPRAGRGRWQSASVAASIAAVALLLSAARPVPRQATLSSGGVQLLAGLVGHRAAFRDECAARDVHRQCGIGQRRTGHDSRQHANLHEHVHRCRAQGDT
jgi:bla regulator protein BlaR1